MQWMDLLLAAGWFISAALYSFTTVSSSVSKVLRPLRVFAMFLSASWGAWYLVSFFIGWQQGQDGLWESKMVHNTADGLMLVTIMYFLVVRLVTTKNINKLIPGG